MLSEAWLWLLFALFGLNLSSLVWKKARREQHAAFSEYVFGLAVGYFVWSFGDEIRGAGLVADITVAALWFTAATPPLTAVWLARDQVLQLARQVAIFALGFGVGLVYISVEFAALSGLGAVAFFIALGRFRRYLRTQLQQWRWRRNERRSQPEEIPARPEDQKLIDELQKKVATAEYKKERQEAALEKLRDQQEQKAEHQNRRRQEIFEQVQRIRREQRSAMEKGTQAQGLHHHPSSYGFLLAEATRVLRAEIQAGERVPAIEADPFLFEVVERLLQADDFETRYFHRAGAKAIAAVESYLAGDHPLDAARSTLQRLKLEPEHVAPEPLVEPFLNSLLEAWLEPHRKFQTQQWQLFNAKKHPEQGRLSDFLRTQGLEHPEVEKWRDCWDASPALFVGKPIPAKHPRKIRRRWPLTSWRS